MSAVQTKKNTDKIKNQYVQKPAAVKVSRKPRRYRASETEYKIIKENAEAAGMGIGEYIRQKAMERKRE